MKIYPYYPAQLVPLRAKIKGINAVISSVVQNGNAIIITTESGKVLHYQFDQVVYCIPE